MKDLITQVEMIHTKQKEIFAEYKAMRMSFLDLIHALKNLNAHAAFVLKEIQSKKRAC